VVLLGAESERPYERPPLSKDYLRGEAGREKVYVHEDGFYEENEIELRVRTSVAAIDAAAREAVLESGERLAFDRLLLATGAAPRKLDVPGHDLEGIHYLRDVEDSDLLRARLDAGSSGSVVVIGAGWIGAEVAASARQKGLDVTLVEGDVAGREFIAYWVKGGRVVAGMNANVWDVTEEIQAQVRSGAQTPAGASRGTP
jgi:3-phenylpropionate/trans-cinnamate dioxygenase ferredoxin reductase component